MLLPSPHRGGAGLLCALTLVLLAAGAATPAHATPAATVTIEPTGVLQTSSTFFNGTFRVLNESSAGETIVRVRIDFSTAILPDQVYDPTGAAGDVVGKDFTIDDDPGVGILSDTFLFPHDGGFDALELTFDDYDTGELFTFSVDADPTSIQGSSAPGPNDSGSVNGLELAGSEVTVEFSDGTTLVGNPYRLGASETGSTVALRTSVPAQPTLQVLGVPVPPANVFDAAQTVRISGPVGADVSLLQLEGGLYTAGLPGGGFDLDPFEANTVVAVDEHFGTIGGSGFVDIPITLTIADGNAGIAHLMAVIDDGAGVAGPTSNVAVLQYQPGGPPPIGFDKSSLAGVGPLNSPTTLQWGPDGRLYVGEQHGLIRAFTVARNGPSDYTATALETIPLIQQIPNHNDDGTVNGAPVNDRQMTGILVTGTAANPVIYAGSSDPRIGAGPGGGDTGLDTNSAILSRLTWNGASWDKLDLVVGLPRSEENHSINGLEIDEATNTLYATIGGSTNMGATSNNFAFTPEYAYSASIISVDLDAIGETTYFLPTLDDEDRAGPVDAGDPFGGNDGKNQAVLEPAGPVQIFAPGFRNPYDVVITQAGRIYSVDNGPNGGWGDVPVGEGAPGCTNAVNEPGNTYGDSLHYITGAGYYGGHANPTRGNIANTFNPTNPQSPIFASNEVECDYRIPGVQNGALHVFPFSTNGLAEYTASNFGGAMQGDLLAAGFNNSIQRIQLDASGTTATLVESLFAGVGALPLDVTSRGDAEAFAGSIWVADFSGSAIVVFEPTDLLLCTGVDDPFLDEDGDGYTNADEIDNGTAPCSAGDRPPDWDADFVSNLNDPDDDDDGTPDTSDPFAVDPQDGLTTIAPVQYTWDNNAPPAGGLEGLGFTGLMTNGAADYESLFDAAQMTAGGAAGVTTIDAVGEGDARDAGNDQTFAFQFGLRADPTRDGPFTARTRILAPFAGLTLQGDESMGLMVGTGNQDDYAKLVVTASAGGGIEFGTEVGGTFVGRPVDAVVLPGPNAIDLLLRVDPQAATVEPFYQVIDGGGPGPLVPLGGPEPVPAGWFGATAGLAVGIISTSRGPAPPFAVTWDFIEALPETAACADGLDNDGDGLSDLSDPGCAGAGDGSELGPVQEDFEDLSDGSDPADWLDTEPDALTEDDSLFASRRVGFQSFLATASEATNIHSHYTAPGTGALTNYEFTGRMRITDPDGGIGVTFFSDYPNSDAYYRMRRLFDGSFHLASHGTAITGGVDDSGVVPLANVWYWFRIRVEDTGSRTEIRARVWSEGAAEPGAWQIDAFDDSPTRLTQGTVGVWAFHEGEKHWDDFSVEPIAPPATDLVLTVLNNGNGSVNVDPLQATYSTGETVTLTAVPDAGWGFTGWSGDLTGGQNPADVVMTGDRTITANFAEITQHTLTLVPVGAGQIVANPSQPLYDLGSTVTLTAVPDPGFAFSGWSGDLTGSQNPANLLITGDMTVSATFGSQSDVLNEDFQGTPPGSNPVDWLDTASDSLVEDDTLFQVVDLGADNAFHSITGQPNIHSHYVGTGASTWTNYEFSGRMRTASADAGIGVTLFSDYPNTDTYYRLRRFFSGSFHLDPHGTSMTGGVDDSGVVPTASVWYRFRIQVEDTGARTEVRARIWEDGTAEPGVWQIDAWDDSPTRLTFGTVGVWSFWRSGNTWDDLVVSLLTGPTPDCADAIDNDGDGLIDGADPGCDDAADLSERSPLLPCDDGADNDADGLFDFPIDISCAAPTSAAEETTCSDGRDNDKDGTFDHDGAGQGPPDANCSGDPTLNAEARSCGLGFEVGLLLPLLARLRRRRNAGQ